MMISKLDSSLIHTVLQTKISILNTCNSGCIFLILFYQLILIHHMDNYWGVFIHSLFVLENLKFSFAWWMCCMSPCMGLGWWVSLHVDRCEVGGMHEVFPFSIFFCPLFSSGSSMPVVVSCSQCWMLAILIKPKWKRTNPRTAPCRDFGQTTLPTSALKCLLPMKVTCQRILAPYLQEAAVAVEELPMTVPQ